MKMKALGQAWGFFISEPNNIHPLVSLIEICFNFQRKKESHEYERIKQIATGGRDEWIHP